MNYIISSIVLLVVILIIIYILSIDNNIEKIKIKMTELFSAIKSNKTNYINDIDAMLLLNFIKSKYNKYDNIMIPKKIYYTKLHNDYIMKDVNVLFTSNKTDETVKLLIRFTPIMNDLFIGQYSLFGLNGNYSIETDEITNVPIDNLPIIQKKDYRDILSEMIPDMIEISDDIAAIASQPKRVSFAFP